MGLSWPGNVGLLPPPSSLGSQQCASAGEAAAAAINGRRCGGDGGEVIPFYSRASLSWSFGCSGRRHHATGVSDFPSQKALPPRLRPTLVSGHLLVGGGNLAVDYWKDRKATFPDNGIINIPASASRTAEMLAKMDRP
uniref:Uncharacterized protein n=1 Tax=Oryza barthii TaxID=65489 RepID=A0A0D3HP16_9ORYZ